MKAYLYDVKRHFSGQEYPSENEFIVVSDNDSKRDDEAERIYQFILDNAKDVIQNSELGNPQLVENELILECQSREIDWFQCQEQQSIQSKCRPRGVGCCFRGGGESQTKKLSDEKINVLKESIQYFMDSHRKGAESYLFIGSKWDLKIRLRYGEIVMFGASGIELASDIVQLHFLSPELVTTYINWCCPIYTV